MSGPRADRAEHFESWSAARLAEFERGHSDDEIGRAALHTARSWDIPPAHTEAFLASMRADLTVDTYADLHRPAELHARLRRGDRAPDAAAAAPGGPELAAEPARALGIAFQLTNFVRDVGEDLARGRLYLPAEDLAAHGVTRADLERGDHTPAVRDLMAFQVARARSWYAAAAPGVPMLHPDSRACIDAATRLYRGILDEIERNDYRVLDRRARVGPGTRLRVGVGAYTRARRSWSSDAKRASSQVHQPSVHSASANPNSRSSTGA